MSLVPTWQYLMCMTYIANDRSKAIFPKKVLFSEENEHTVEEKPDETFVNGASYYIRKENAMKAPWSKVLTKGLLYP